MKHSSDNSVHFRPRYYLATDPRAIIYIVGLTLFAEGIIFLGYLYFGRSVPLLHFMAIFAGVMCLGMLSLLEFVRLDGDGITYYPFFQKKKQIFWKNICCSGDFYHNAIMSGRFVRGRFFYFSTKPIPGGVDYTRQLTMPRATDSFLFVADQRDVESVIKQFVPKSKFCCTIPLDFCGGK